MKEIPPLKGLRREMAREDFEALAALQCGIPEILGYVGTTEPKLARWVRRAYGMGLPEAMEMLRQDGLIEIRRASFEQLKKSATLIQQQYVRFLTPPEAGKQEEALRLAREVFSLAPGEDSVRALFTEEE